MAQLAQRQQLIAQEKLRRKQSQQALTKGLVQLGLMGVGALTGGLGAIPAIGLGAGGLGGALTGAGMGSTVGGLLGNAVTGQPTSVGEALGGLQMATGIYNQGVRADAYTDRNMGKRGYVPLGEDMEIGADDIKIGNRIFTPGGADAGWNPRGDLESAAAHARDMAQKYGAQATIQQGDDGLYTTKITIKPDDVLGSSPGGTFVGQSKNRYDRGYQAPYTNGQYRAAENIWKNQMPVKSKLTGTVYEAGTPGWFGVLKQDYNILPENIEAIAGDYAPMITPRGEEMRYVNAPRAPLSREAVDLKIQARNAIEQINASSLPQEEKEKRIAEVMRRLGR